MSHAPQQNASSSKDDKVTIQNKKGYVNNIIGQEKETAEGCTSDSGSVETRIQAPNSYFAGSSSEELSDSDDEGLQENIVHFVHT